MKLGQSGCSARHRAKCNGIYLVCGQAACCVLLLELHKPGAQRVAEQLRVRGLWRVHTQKVAGPCRSTAAKIPSLRARCTHRVDIQHRCCCVKMMLS